MGLLDDAIHEHLELRRLRGADPSEVIREEREAFGSALRVGGREPARHMVDFEELPIARSSHPVDEPELHASPDLSHLSQETVELDMRAVLEAESIDGDSCTELDTLPSETSATPPRARGQLSASGEGSTEDSLEWEMPRERRDDFVGQSREKELPPPSDVRRTPAGEVLAGRLNSLP